MALLPRKIGRFTLLHSVGDDGVTELYDGIQDGSGGNTVIIRRVLPHILRNPELSRIVSDRIADLLPIRDPSILTFLEYIEHNNEHYIISEWSDSVSLERIIEWCKQTGTQIPNNVFLHIVTHMCRGFDALHRTPGAQTDSDAVLHLGVMPSAFRVERDGQVRLAHFGLVSSPANTLHTGGYALRVGYLSPEQTRANPVLSPASDLFCFGAVLYELLMLKPMFSESSPLRTIAQIRTAQVTTQLLEVKEILPGLDRVLYRALSRNPRHRYPKAFVLREDLRGLMAGYSFSNIERETQNFLEPLFRGSRRAIDDILPLPNLE